MMRCWNPNPSKRPIFLQLKTDLEALLKSYSQERLDITIVYHIVYLHRVFRVIDHQNIVCDEET